MAAIAAYRHLLRAARIAFQGDQPILNAARAQIRTGFRENASLDPKSPEIDGHIKHAEDVATILRENVVQGRRSGDKYKLRIHEHTERGDNDTVKMAGGKTVKIGGGCCSS
ncbi:Mitochondrial zinc maintenance protein 1 [Pestalotiopsis fici W106-1]|uniref:Mitochondrial zinc maintenance protein 1, mitochondrial n=1 Tax=Pestalotiopsis fici (strain W106-1 / CGMCC3.15140) TaxID=1229662 RepID=W3XEE2_PESFW|nr:Mitochondrial zinc maintenance protein 1 [Pestalotiopsis fici W106-1]ETS84420.1 Mitochondrial zinc maintenance protein 1 [Pestalotiopsis fici W106-1]